MLRTELASERIQRIDQKTGIKVIQLTSYPTPTAHLLYDWPSITPDNERVIFFVQREARRGAPWDLFRCDTDGLNLFQLTEETSTQEEGGYYGAPTAQLTLDGKTVYIVWRHKLCSVELKSGAITEIADLKPHCSEGSEIGKLFLSQGGEKVFLRAGKEKNLRVDLSSGTVHQIDIGGTLFAACHDQQRLVVQRGGIEWGTKEGSEAGVRTIINKTNLSFWTTDEDGGDERLLGPWNFAHATLIGGTSTVQGCGLPPDRCIWTVSEGQEPKKLVEGPYFWHSGSSLDGQWIVSDTNWPDQGLQLIHIPTGNFRTLCHPGATQDHVEFGHPHPTVSQDGKLVLFRSDRTGVSQMYIAHVTEEFKQSVIDGDLDHPYPKWL